jgi:hypothetical protein
VQEKRKLVINEQAREQQEMAECTFQPHLRPSRESLRTADHGESGMNVQQRSALWAARRQAKLDAQQRDHIEKELLAEECTFKPNVSVTDKRKRMVRIRRATTTAEATATSRPQVQDSSFNKFVERQQRARAEKQRMQDAQGRTGAKWTGQRTIARAPVLESERRIRQRNQRQQHIEAVERERLRLEQKKDSKRKNSNFAIPGNTKSQSPNEDVDLVDEENRGRTGNEQGGGDVGSMRSNSHGVRDSVKSVAERETSVRQSSGGRSPEGVIDSHFRHKFGAQGLGDLGRRNNDITSEEDDDDEDIFLHYPTLRNKLKW